MRPYGVAPAGFVLPDGTRIGRVRLLVADLERSLDYYQGIVGLQVLERSGGQAVLGVSGPHPLVEVHERPGARAVPKRGRFGLYHFAILLPDRAALGRFAGHLFRMGIRAGMSDHLVSESLYLNDPDGLGIEVYADRPRHTWRHAHRELLMAVDPLDIDSVIAAGGGLPWTGAPAGTVLGHMHLHVGDLDLASAFYHEALGFEKMVWSYPGALFLTAGGYHHHLGTNTWSPGPAPAEDEAQLLEWELVVPGEGVGKAAESVAGAGYSVTRVGADRVARDPWGTAVRLRPA